MSGKKIAIVTGASSGMGREMVYLLADHFAALEEIWVVARRKERLEELVGKVPVRLRILPLDLTSEEDLGALSVLLKREQPNVKILVNGAGYGKTGAVGTIRRDLSVGMVRLNDEALVAVTEMVLPYISKNSRIIQFASAAAFMPQPGFAVYAASKSFVLSYSRALAVELKKKNIYVTAVCPGPVETEFFGIALDGEKLAHGQHERQTDLSVRTLDEGVLRSLPDRSPRDLNGVYQLVTAGPHTACGLVLRITYSNRKRDCGHLSSSRKRGKRFEITTGKRNLWIQDCLQKASAFLRCPIHPGDRGTAYLKKFCHGADL